jgi:hypothetical protein
LEFDSAKLQVKRSRENSTVEEVYNELTGITTECLLNYVKPLKGTPFVSVREAYLEYPYD